MPRGLHSNTIAALASDSFNLATLIQFDFSTTIRITDWGRNVYSGGSTWTSSSHLIGVDAPQETQGLRVNTLNISLSGVDPYFNNIFLSETSGQSTYLDAPVKVYRAVMNDSDGVIGQRFLVFQGLVTGFDIADSKDSSTLTVECASHWKDFEKENGRRTNNNSQKVFFPDDKGFRFAAESIKDIRWGKE